MTKAPPQIIELFDALKRSLERPNTMASKDVQTESPKKNRSPAFVAARLHTEIAKAQAALAKAEEHVAERRRELTELLEALKSEPDAVKTLVARMTGPVA